MSAPVSTTIKGGKEAIERSYILIDDMRRGDVSIPELSIHQIQHQLSFAVSRVMSEGALYDRELAALAIKQAQGDLPEACFLLRAFRTTLPRFGYSLPLRVSDMTVERRISTTQKDVPGGQILGPTFDYTYRLLRFDLMDESNSAAGAEAFTGTLPPDMSHLAGELPYQADADLFEVEHPDRQESDIADLTREPLHFPTRRDQRLQNLTRGDEGFLVGLAYSSIRGYGRNHPFIAELRVGDVVLDFEIPEIGIVVEIGEIKVTECSTVHPTFGQGAERPRFTKGYGIAFGANERKAISMALIDRAQRADEFAESRRYPVQDEEFVFYHTDSVASSGMVQHLKLPHYVDFQAQVQLMSEIADEQSARSRISDTIAELGEDD